MVGKFVEFFGEGAESLSLPDRATIANMAPEYGATMGFFPVDDVTIEYFKGTGRTAEEIDAFTSYFKAQGLYGIPKKGDIDYSQVLELNLSSSCALAGRTQASAGSHRDWQGEERFFDPFLQAGSRERLQQIGGRAGPPL